jgi:hypothetical protein
MRRELGGAGLFASFLNQLCVHVFRGLTATSLTIFVHHDESSLRAYNRKGALHFNLHHFRPQDAMVSEVYAWYMVRATVLSAPHHAVTHMSRAKWYLRAFYVQTIAHELAHSKSDCVSHNEAFAKTMGSVAASFLDNLHEIVEQLKRRS